MLRSSVFRRRASFFVPAAVLVLAAFMPLSGCGGSRAAAQGAHRASPGAAAAGRFFTMRISAMSGRAKPGRLPAFR